MPRSGTLGNHQPYTPFGVFLLGQQSDLTCYSIGPGDFVHILTAHLSIKSSVHFRIFSYLSVYCIPRILASLPKL